MTRLSLLPSTLLALITLIAAGCSTTASQAPTQDQKTPVVLSGQPLDEQGSFEAATLYALLVAELAAHRGMPQVTLHNYVREAERTGDLQITKRATRLAEQHRNSSQRLKAAKLWLALEPENAEPNNIVAAELIHQGELDQALPLLKAALSNDSLLAVDALAERAQKMPDSERQQYLELVDELLLQSPEQPKLLYVKASLIRYQGDVAQAIELAQLALAQDPQFDRAILLEADLQARSGHLDTALGHLREQLNQRDHKQMRTLYTRLLLQKGQFDAATQQADKLSELYPNDVNLKFYLGALMLEHNQIERSEHYFNQLTHRFGLNSTLHYYLGRIAQIKQLRDEALNHFQQIGESPYLMAGMSEVGKMLDQPTDESQLRQIYQQSRDRHPKQSATLYALEATWLAEQDKSEQAFKVYRQALNEHPDDTRLLYNRAMLSEQHNDLETMEHDLRKLLQIEPQNATALNALGYSLTDRTDRHQEALALIRQALKLKPDDPAILDSMGWVYYKLGDYKLALQYLLRAYQSFPDPEIASHLGQAYWKLGQTDKARRIWDEALQRNPDNRLIQDAMRWAEQQQ